jgi:ferredoxin/flavodoxin---NADP+ reductase
MAGPLEYNATLESREDFSDVLSTFRVVPDEPIAPDDARAFVPGQYMTLGLNNEGNPDLGSVRRPMSIASAPHQRETLDFYIRYVSSPASDNPLTHLMWNLKPGDRLYMRNRPAGKFTVDDTIGTEDPRTWIYVAAGTGLAPFTSIVFDDAHTNPSRSLARHVIMHGSSYDHELGYRTELEALATGRQLRYLPSVSRPQHCPNWSGANGRVEDFFKADRLADTEHRMEMAEGSLTPENTAIFICGLNGTIQQTIERLLPRGFIPDNRRIKRALGVEELPSSIFFEQYDNEPIVDIKNEDEVARLKALLPSA